MSGSAEGEKRTPRQFKWLPVFSRRLLGVKKSAPTTYGTRLTSTRGTLPLFTPRALAKLRSGPSLSKLLESVGPKSVTNTKRVRTLAKPQGKSLSSSALGKFVHRRLPAPHRCCTRPWGRRKPGPSGFYGGEIRLARPFNIALRPHGDGSG